MTDTIESRLKETSQTCLDAYLAWDKNKKDSKSYEMLHNAVHELRKVASRLEIELAASERDSVSEKIIQPPRHKTSKMAEGEKSDRPRQRKPRKPKTAEGSAA